MKLIYPVILVVLSLCGGCGQKAQPQATDLSPEEPWSEPSPSPAVPLSQAPIVLPAPSPLPSPQPISLGVRVSFTVNQARDEVRKDIVLVSVNSGRTFSLGKPIVLPPNTPETVTFAFDPLFIKKNGITSVIAYTAYREGENQSRGLSVKWSTDPISGISGIVVSGVRSLLSDKAGERATLIVELQSKPGSSIQIRLPLRTPPAPVELKQMSVNEFATRGSFPKFLQTLKTVALRLDLLQVVTVRNPSTDLVRVTLPLELRGRLFTHIDTIQVNQKWCSYSLDQSGREEVLGTEFYFLPLTEGLPRTFLTVITEAMESNSVALTLEPGEEAAFGLYGQGQKIADLTTKGAPRSNLQPVEVPTGCRSRCGNPRQIPASWDPAWKAHQYWESQGWPGASRVCEALRNTNVTRTRLDDPFPNEEMLNQCAEWELSNGTSPWDDHRFCYTPPPGNPWHYPAEEKWIIRKSTEAVQVGTKVSPVFLELDPGSISASLHLVSSDPDDKSEQRQMTGFLQPKVKQAE